MKLKIILYLIVLLLLLPVLCWAKPIGFVGCSITNDAVAGYQALGGQDFWKINRVMNYGGGSLFMWYFQLVSGVRLGQQDYWGIYQYYLARNPDTKVVWWELCSSSQVDMMNYDEVLLVLNEIKRLAPGATVYASPMPPFPDTVPGTGSVGPVCADRLAITLTNNFVYGMVNQGEVFLGPIMTPLNGSQTTANECHGNKIGNKIWGEDLLGFDWITQTSP